MNDILIEPITEIHFEDLLKLFVEFAAFENLSDIMTNSTTRMIAEKEYINGFVAKNSHNKIIAYTTHFFSYHTFVGKCLYMDDLYVCPEYRGKGLGTMLINKVITVAKENKCARLRWQVSNWNKPAIEFYKNLGGIINETERNVDLFLER